MRLTQAQVRQLAEVNEETYRVWRDALPPLGRRSGRGTHFTLGDAVAVTAIRALVSGFGVKVQKLAPASPALFDACADAVLPGRSPSMLVVTADQACLRHASAPLTEIEEAALTVPLQPIIDRIQAQVLQSDSPVQAVLPLGPTELTRQRRAS